MPIYRLHPPSTLRLPVLRNFRHSSTLPPELIAVILRFALPEFIVDPFAHSAARRVFGQVNGRVRSILHTTPDLWTGLLVTLATPMSHIEEFMTSTTPSAEDAVPKRVEFALVKLACISVELDALKCATQNSRKLADSRLTRIEFEATVTRSKLRRALRRIEVFQPACNGSPLVQPEEKVCESAAEYVGTRDQPADSAQRAANELVLDFDSVVLCGVCIMALQNPDV
ncbi:hypothetical protein B0H16DRAFT_1745935 [Mycena metata]|uniref:Uncharacterized protein n=1 Tax=Mycena metata TaxID=1033252 RepID=A0AAD7H0Z5_9AGAR|nr:hypothetical protein B0H16DRAFT_1745935 [Mycena metata]